MKFFFVLNRKYFQQIIIDMTLYFGLDFSSSWYNFNNTYIAYLYITSLARNIIHKLASIYVLLLDV